MQDKNSDLNSLIYFQAYPGAEPTRYEAIRYSTWRVYLFQELESFRAEDL